MDYKLGQDCCGGTKYWSDSQIAIVRRYDCINETVKSWLKELNKEDERQVNQDGDFSKNDSDLVEESEEKIISLPVDDCCKRRPRR